MQLWIYDSTGERLVTFPAYLRWSPNTPAEFRIYPRSALPEPTRLTDATPTQVPMPQPIRFLRRHVDGWQLATAEDDAQFREWDSLEARLGLRYA